MSKKTAAAPVEPAESLEPQPLSREDLAVAIKEAQAKGSKENAAFRTIADGKHGWQHPAFREVWHECLGVTSKPAAKPPADR